jgi:hypothetical protein
VRSSTSWSGPVAAPIAASMSRLDRAYDSADRYVGDMRSQGLVGQWDEYWEAAYRDELREDVDGVRPRTSPDAVREDRAYTATQDPRPRPTPSSPAP